MRNVAFWIIWVFAFTVPWDVVALPGLGTISRLTGILALGVAAVTVAAEGRFRKPDAVFGFSIAFTTMAVLSVLWSVSAEATLQRAWTYAQLLGMVWMLREFARSRERQEALLFAYCLGLMVAIADTINNFRVTSGSSTRFAMAGFNENDLGLTLAIGLPMAWHLALRQRGLIRVIPIVCLMLAPVIILLTGSRGSFLAALVALSIVPLTVPRLSLRSISIVVSVFVIAGVGAAVFVPDTTWARIGTTRTELFEGGNLTGRMDIWKAGLDIFPERPLLGVGAGAFTPAIERAINMDYVPHNALLGVLVEQGLIGFLLFAALLSACAMTILRLPRGERTLWTAVMLCWLVGVMSVNWQYRKATWLLFGLLAAQSSVKRTTAPSVNNRIANRAPAVPLRSAYPEPVPQRRASR